MHDDDAAGTIGLTNLGNTCYMNSVLQALSNIEPFARYFLHLAQHSDLASSRPSRQTRSIAQQSSVTMLSITDALRDVIAALWAEDRTTAFSPDAFLEMFWRIVPSFKGFKQHVRMC